MKRTIVFLTCLLCSCAKPTKPIDHKQVELDRKNEACRQVWNFECDPPTVKELEAKGCKVLDYVCIPKE